MRKTLNELRVVKLGQDSLASVIKQLASLERVIPSRRTPPVYLSSVQLTATEPELEYTMEIAIEYPGTAGILEVLAKHYSKGATAKKEG